MWAGGSGARDATPTTTNSSSPPWEGEFNVRDTPRGRTESAAHNCMTPVHKLPSPSHHHEQLFSVPWGGSDLGGRPQGGWAAPTPASRDMSKARIHRRGAALRQPLFSCHVSLLSCLERRQLDVIADNDHNECSHHRSDLGRHLPCPACGLRDRHHPRHRHHRCFRCCRHHRCCRHRPRSNPQP